jgi:hypothetical protein
MKQKNKEEKPVLKVREEKRYCVNYSDLEDFATKIYNLKDYSFVAIEECGNDSSHDFVVSDKINKHELKDVEEIKNGNVKEYRNRLLLDLLCKEGYIPPGNYTISVCW